MLNLNNPEYTIATDGEVAGMLSHFNTDYVIDIVRSTITKRVNSYPRQFPNIVDGYEYYFKSQSNNYPLYKQEILQKREETYNTIINIICEEYGMSVSGDGYDGYSLATYLYNNFVSKFEVKMIDFFVNYIFKEKSDLYEQLDLASEKRNKDSSTIYGKKVWKNIKLAIISANLEKVIDNICVQDIDFETYMSLSNMDNKNIARFIISNVIAPDDFFEKYVASWFNGEFRSPLITETRLALQHLPSTDYNYTTINFIKEGE